jgi:hypothetical protein
VEKQPSEKQPTENSTPTDGVKNSDGDSVIRLPLPRVNLDAKIAWQAEPQRTRVPLHAKFAKASVTRRTPGVDSDWTPVIARKTGTQVVKK